MQSTDQRSPKEQVFGLMQELEKDYLKWYEKAFSTWIFGYKLLQISSLFLGFATAVVSAFISVESFEIWGKPTLTILPLLSTFFGALLTQGKFRDMLQIREEGRISILELIYEGREGLMKAESDQDIVQLYRKLYSKLITIERTQLLRATKLFENEFVANFIPYSLVSQKENSLSLDETKKPTSK